MANESINLNLIPTGEMPVIHVSQFDNGRAFNVNLFKGSDEYTIPEGYTAELHCRKADRNIVTLATTNVSSNTLTFTTTTQLCACAGDNLCEVAIKDNEDYLVGSLNFILQVEKDPLQGGIQSTSEIYDLTDQIEDIATELIGENYYTKTETDTLLDAKADTSDIPTKTSELINDSGFLTEANIPTKTSDLINDSGFITEANIPTKTSDLINDSGFITSSSLPDMTQYYTKSQVDNLINAIKTGPAVTYTAPSAIRPTITVDNNATYVRQSGKNQFSYNFNIHNGYWGEAAYVGDDTILPIEQAEGWTHIRIPVKAGASISFSGFQAQYGVYDAFLGSDDPTDIISTFLNGGLNNKTMIVPAGAKYLGICTYRLCDNYSTYPNPQVEYGTAVTAYEQYNTNSADYTVANIGNIVSFTGFNTLYADNGNINVTVSRLLDVN